MNPAPKTIKELQACVAEFSPLAVRGAGTKTALSSNHPNAVDLDLSRLRGILEYDPSEFTFTALAGTPITDIQTALAENGQYLPFDPPFATEGATLGGTVAAGLSGPRRLRYGGVRDFIIGINYVDGEARLISGGGKVVKNSAGFDLPKLFTGSLGTYGAIAELTFKVFPSPKSRLHLTYECEDLDDALTLQQEIVRSQWEPEAIDLEPPYTLHLTLAGTRSAIKDVARRIGRDSTTRRIAFQPVRSDARYIIKLPLTPNRMSRLDSAFSGLGITRRYSVAGNVGWLSFSDAEVFEALDGLLVHEALPALVLKGDTSHMFLGPRPKSNISGRIKNALDPTNRFVGGYAHPATKTEA